MHIVQKRYRLGSAKARAIFRVHFVLSNRMPTAEQYRQSAEQCRRVAARTEDRHERETLLRIAVQWDRLADHKQRIEEEKA